VQLLTLHRLRLLHALETFSSYFSILRVTDSGAAIEKIDSDPY